MNAIIVNLMTETEARKCVEEIKRGVLNIRVRLLELYEREGWRALGYGNWRDCVTVEFDQSQSYLYRQLEAAQVERNISPIGEIGIFLESHARPLTSLEPEQQREAWALAVETAPEGKVTGAHVQKIVDELTEAPRPHVTHNSGNNEWYTPPEYIEAARQVMGDIDLDPASSEIANKTVHAATFYTQEDDGLLYDWACGTCWMNPPYASHLIGLFANKLAEHVKRGDVSEACVLVNNATETAWFNALLDLASCVCFIRGRVKFIDMDGKASGAPLQGQAVLYIGPNAEAFGKAFSDFGRTLYARRDPE